MVLEQGREFTTAGAGIQLSPNCSRVLHYLGLESALRTSAFLPEGTQFRHWRKGQVIAESLLGSSVAQRYGAPYYHIHRGDLLTALLAAARAHSNIELRTDAQVTGCIAQADGAVRVQVNNQQESATGLIGADGIHSQVRRSLWGEQQPTFTGNVAWRMLVPVSKLPKDMVRPMSTVWWGPGKHFVHYYVRGGDYVNCVCVVEKSGWQVESWTESGDILELQQDFAGWHPHVVELINQADASELFKWALFDRPPMTQWGKGCITLLGDACQTPAVAEAMQHYEDLRRKRTAGIQRGSRRNAKVFHLSGIAAWLRNRAAGRARANTMDELFRYDPLTVVSDERSRYQD